jgi:hypothetical protein
VPSPESRAAAVACLLIVVATLALGVDIVIEQFPRGLVVLAWIAVSLIAAWYRAIQHPWREWSAPDFEVDSDRPVPAGIDAEAVMLEPPLRFRIRPEALRVRIAHAHPGASPSAVLPEGPLEASRALARIALGRLP